MIEGIKLDPRLPEKGWHLDRKGYVVYSSRKKGRWKRGQRAHRMAVGLMLEEWNPFRVEMDESLHVQHLNFDKRDNRGENLLLAPAQFNPSGAMRCPFTGQFMNAGELKRRLGLRWRKEQEEPSEPDWVTREEQEDIEQEDIENE